ncbi:MAG: hypothetical protein DMG47_21525 [Acidobacteria bacterium]|jgi:hypothetical protein|nr:MAG: hypothetical protein DMG47_21525 [Acidobacteriota bacterium]HLB86765.1 hypothetical protein [Terriglobales bacterium]
MITSKPANGPNPGHDLLYRVDRCSGKNFLGVQRRKVVSPVEDSSDLFGSAVQKVQKCLTVSAVGYNMEASR